MRKSTLILKIDAEVYKAFKTLMKNEGKTVLRSVSIILEEALKNKIKEIKK